MIAILRLSACTLLLCTLIGNVSAFTRNDNEGNDLYMPREIKRSYERGTRSISGEPGPKYWQNRVDYKITAAIDPETRILEGAENITYQNNSPDTLMSLVVQLHQNMNRKGAVRNSQLAQEAVTDGVTISRASIGGKAIDVGPQSREVRLQGAVMILRLSSPILPGTTTSLEIDWNFTIPKGSNIRMGTYGESVFFLGYWYPKIAVYDDVNGWDTFAYNGEHEFYNEYGDFEVAITVPASYGVWATGTLANPKDVLSKDILRKYNNAGRSREIISVISEADLKSGKVYASSSRTNTWKYQATNCPDFAFGISDHYVWDACSVTLPGGNRARVNVVYDTSTAPFKVVAEEAAKTLEFFTDEFPGIPYPYPQITVFRGDYGMEFPMIVNDGVFPNRITNVYVHTHEIAHQYFPFYVGTNETMYAWMDEGWAYALPFDIQQRLVDYDHRIRAIKGYEKYAGGINDLPLMTPSTALRAPDLDMASYYKPAVAYEILKGVLGEDMYTKALQEYIRRWNGKHPLPYDYFYTINDATGENLNWFWNAWFFEQGVPDIAIKAVDVGGAKLTVTLEKVGNKPIPVVATVQFKDGDSIVLEQSAGIWRDGVTEFRIETEVTGEVVSVSLGSRYIPDSNPENDVWTANG